MWLKGFDMTESLDNDEKNSYYVQLDQLLGLAILPLWRGQAMQRYYFCSLIYVWTATLNWSET